MLHIRLVSAAAAIAIVLATGVAAAQPASSDQTAKPLLPLFLIKQTSTPSAAAHSADTTAKKTKSKKIASKKQDRIAAAQDTDQSADTAESSASASAWLAASGTPTNSAPAAPGADVAPDNAPSNNAQAADEQPVYEQTASGNAYPDDGPSTITIGSASWITQVLAALGGAIAAGAVAWFLIGAGPVRTYG